jgi:hypothetical protein
VRTWRSPLLHFALLGGALFGLRSAVWGENADRERLVVVPAAEVARMAEEARRETGGPATPAELQARVSAWVDEELLVREARARGWHESDPVVRNRLVQNLRFLGAAPGEDADALLARAFELGLDRSDLVVRRRLAARMRLAVAGEAREQEPSRAELEAVLERFAERFREPARVRLDQVFVSRDRHGAALEEDARALLDTLRRENVSPERGVSRGDPSLLSAELPLSSQAELAARLGPEFARRAMDLEPGAWQGPVPSSYGLHLVWVHERQPARMPPLEEVRDAVRATWLAEREREALHDALLALRRRAEVRVEGEPWTPSTSASSAATASR